MTKKRLLSAFLSLCMVFSMVPAAFAEGETENQASMEQSIILSDETGSDVDTDENQNDSEPPLDDNSVAKIDSEKALLEAIDAAKPGATITLSGNVEITNTIIIQDKTLTLDLATHTITASKNIWQDNDTVDAWSLISVRGSSNVTIKGNGTLQALENDSYAVDVYDEDSTCTIKSGIFVGNISAIYVFQGKLIIEGGTFSIQQTETTGEDPYRFLLNCYDQYYKDGIASITVKGGTFEKFNPADCLAEGAGTNFCAAGYRSTGTEDSWTVTPYENGEMVVEAVTSSGGKVSAKLDGVYGNENTTIDSEEGESAPSGEVENGKITIDLSTQGEDPTTSASLEVTKTAAASLDKASGLTVESDVGSVSLPEEALQKVADAESAVTISIQEERSLITDENVKAAYTVEVKNADGENLLPSNESETNGTITITVKKPEGVSDNFQFWYVDNSKGSLLYLEMLPFNATEDGKMAVQIGHLSTIVGIDGNPPEGSIVVATVTTTNGTTTNYSSLNEALNAVAENGGTLEVLTSGEVTLTETLKIEKNVTITGSGMLTLKADNNFENRQKLLNMEANLTIDGAKVTLVPNVTGTGDAIQMGADTTKEITLTLENGADLTIAENGNEGFQNALVMPAGKNGKVVVDSSTLTANNIDGNFANGGVFEIKNSANVTIDDCESYGFSVNQLTVDGNSNVQVSNVQLAAIKTIGDDASVTVKGNSTVAVEKSGGKLPYGSKWGVAAGVVDIGHGNQSGSEDDGSDIPDTPASLTVAQGSSITLTDNTDKNDEDVNFVYLTTTGSIVNNGNVTAVKYEEIPEKNSDVYRIFYKAGEKVYAVVSAKKDSQGDTVSFREPDGRPSVEGFTFVEWEYPTNWTVKDKSVTFTPGDTHEFTVNAALEAVVYTITLDANGGTVDPSSVAADASGKLTSTLPTPTWEGYTFEGWFTAPEGGDKVTQDTEFSEDTTIYAHWTEDSDTPRPSRPSHSSSGSTGGIGTRLPVADEGGTPSVTGFESDTNADLTVDGRYQFRITSLDGHTPVLTVNNSNFTVALASQNGRDYFYVITCAGTPGSTAAVSVDGKYLLTATVGGSASGVVSDTTHPFTVAQGGTYQFRLTAAARPSFAAGSASFTVEYAGQEGNDYFYKVHAVGQAGDGCGFYINGEAQPVAVATIA